MRSIVKFGVLGVALAASGCSTGIFSSGHDDRSRYETGSERWWAEQGELPPGVRRKWYKGKVWPARPRSDAPKQQFTHIYYSQHYWPLPYTCQDREAVRNLIDTQAALGWQGETTMYNRHFDEATQTLTRAGELHLEYILRDVPVERRSVWVQSTFSEELDAARIESVRSAIARRMRTGEEVPLAIRECREFGRPAAEVEVISDLYRSSMPAPRLGATGSTSGSGGESGEGDGGSGSGSGSGGISSGNFSSSEGSGVGSGSVDGGTSSQ